ncbi:hypothetical protein HAP41_0000022355 [Bradyrhizobium barranii subsp. apii]|uniref:Uncharacterized protein n=1 Tax=Bradyrhizobium barranii subsp. apii TaxID=2819348 RepID=A0A8T5V9U3_9BRAD|nr:hypothetical protein [Bradyrhizobium barranii]UPT91424.1 hypothetical protein HAP41_0000022355 [Bradyrhizobium barranii subsp. apii]
MFSYLYVGFRGLTLRPRSVLNGAVVFACANFGLRIVMGSGGQSNWLIVPARKSANVFGSHPHGGRSLRKVGLRHASQRLS